MKQFFLLVSLFFTHSICAQQSTSLVEYNVTFTEKTLVVWTVVYSGGVQGGSVLSLCRPNKNYDFDAIVYGERKPNVWMAGSGWFNRTQDFNTTGIEQTPGKLVKIAISYGLENNKAKVTIYRNDKIIGSYTKGSMLEWSNNTGVLFGLRHHLDGNNRPGKPWVNALIEEARIYKGVLTAEQIKALTPEIN